MANRVCVCGVGSYEKKKATAATAEAEKSFIAKKASSVEHKKYCTQIFFVRISHTVS